MKYNVDMHDGELEAKMALLEKTHKLTMRTLTAIYSVAMLALAFAPAHAYDPDLAWVYETEGRPALVQSSKSAALAGGMESRRLSSAGSFAAIDDLETRARSRAASDAVNVDARKLSGMFMFIR